MLDPASATNLAFEGIGICVKVISALKMYVETVKNAHKELSELLLSVQRLKNNLELLRITTMQLQHAGLGDFMLTINQERSQAIMGELTRMIVDIAGKKGYFGPLDMLTWPRHKSAVMQLLASVKEEEEAIVKTIQIVGVNATLYVGSQIAAMQKSLERQSQLTEAFSNFTVRDDSILVLDDDGTQARQPLTWVGYYCEDTYNALYIKERHKLSDAAYNGDWDEFFKVLERGQEIFNECWINAPRLKPSRQKESLTLWTPLHQAVYTNAPKETVERLISKGASRLLRTRLSDYVYADMLALELAHELERADLYSLLEPVETAGVPRVVVDMLQGHLHDLIRSDLGSKVDDQHTRLPELEVLTELGNQPMWFPIILSDSIGGYLFQFDRRDLLVRAINTTSASAEKTYRINMEGVLEIQRPLILTEQD